MPVHRVGHTTAVIIGSERLYLTANQRDDGSLGEVFIHWGKHGTSSAGLVSTYAIALSMGLRHRVPLPELIRPGLDQEFMPNGHTNDPEIPRVRSAVDYVARRLAIDWLPYPERAALGVLTRAERVRRRELAAAFNVPALFGVPLTNVSSAPNERGHADLGERGPGLCCAPLLRCGMHARVRVAGLDGAPRPGPPAASSARSCDGIWVWLR